MSHRTQIFLSVLALALPLSAHAGHGLERQTIAANDGWAAQTTTALPQGTTGGSAADAAHVFTVSDRNALVAALNFPDATPKIIRIEGMIDANVDADGNPLTCEDYARADATTGELYSLPAFLAAYDPTTWGRVNPSGPQERARVASAAAQQARVRIRVPANTTIIGADHGDGLRGAWLDIRPSSTSGNQPMNVIVRNLLLVDSYDCFPQWAPTDGADGNWNSLYDAISVRNATHVWIDHNAFLDVATRDEDAPTYFNRLYQRHDGLVDVTNESDNVTVSWNLMANHDKAMLIGSSDGASADRNKLRVTLHHNLFHDLGQRVPRVRFGQVHVFNNQYTLTNEGALTYGYSWGAGIESQIVAQNNHFLVPEAVTPDLFVERFNGTALRAEGTLRNGLLRHARVDVVAAFNAVNPVPLDPNVAWTPTLYRRIDPTALVPLAVILGAGPFK
ncbi:MULTISPECIES: hypothetical protein [unclassified Lysobacter]|uniref:pectate lyase family protein n=1 Tax=unclassified Lysobacter TaxID=2635362 RepID=UPI001C22E109|nr:hypothetical protein [Lysobacter sp. MMG2]MBU8975991.1 hypothetical protein [Lysobacter sp. MMG2]